MENIRVRFAPSPTGHLHIGGARTALFNHLFARHGGGTFILRIEDTDRSRSTQEHIVSIIEAMKWLGLHWDEGPFRQTERFEIYRRHAQRLIGEGKAYHCYCTSEELERMRERASSLKLPPKYDGRCRALKEPVPGRASSVRFKMPERGSVVVEDMVKGKVVFENAQLDDLIIIRSDGTPTYNFVVVADDVEMGITHVIRGDDHLNNTPKQIHIYGALGYGIPRFAHLPMILGSDKTRLSKRHGATSVMAYKETGYLPDALVNYLVRLGWSHGDKEVFTRDELIELFDFESVGKSAAVFNPEKLLWLNAEYIKNTPPDELARLVRPFLSSESIAEEEAEIDRKWLSKAVETQRERAKTLVELANSLRYYLTEDYECDARAKERFLTGKSLPGLKGLREGISSLAEFSPPQTERLLRETAERLGMKLGALAQPLRVALTGRAESPGIFEVMDVLGREKVLRRMDRAISDMEGAGDE